MIAAAALQVSSSGHADSFSKHQGKIEESAHTETIMVTKKRDYLEFLLENKNVQFFNFNVIPNPRFEDAVLLAKLGCEVIEYGFNTCNSSSGPLRCTLLLMSKGIKGSNTEVLNATDAMLEFIDLGTKLSCAEWAKVRD